MTFPAARVSDQTATGDTLLPPGMPTVLIGGLPAATVGGQAMGPVLNAGPGNIVLGSFTVFISGQPAARVTSLVVGQTATPAGPIPVATTIVRGQPNVLIGG